MILSRRSLLKLGALVFAQEIISPNYLSCLANNSLKQNTVGRLYVRNNSNFFPQNKLEKAVEQTIKAFSNVGINFQDVNIDKKGHYPELKGLDIMMLISDYFNYFGVFGIREENQLYQPTKNEFDFPYNQNIAKTNLGIIAPKNLFEFLKQSKSKTDRFQSQVSELLTHEIGHGFGAAHIYPLIKNRHNYFKVSTFFMCAHEVTQSKKFYSDTIKQMHEFIEKVKEGNLNREEIFKLRNQYVKNFKYIGF